MLRKIIRGGFKRVDKKNDDYRFEITNHQLHQICQTENISLYIQNQQVNYLAHIIRKPKRLGPQPGKIGY